ncbi:MAG: NAD-dependent DNA ligase LigA [Clostridiales Family XIII bacterium]|jgi:DNA ligase (NAD+)|nr:NAD-dependent DNA ligase LigA [Clostridiales Family XIII bacterium]
MDRQRFLTEKLSEAAKAYYAEDREILSNFEYDELYDELSALESGSGVVLAGSPTARVGYGVSEELEKRAHAQPMLSLAKTKSKEELAAWLGSRSGLLSYKLDGLTVALTYREGRLYSAVTRGDGTVGELITGNAAAFGNLPYEVPYRGEFTVRGEAVIRYSDFKIINDSLSDDAAKYKNPRNLVSGSVRQLDPSVTASRRVRFYAFALTSSAGPPSSSGGLQAPEDSRAGQFGFLESLGFETVGHELATGAAELEKSVDDFTKKASGKGFDLPVDGLVLSFDDIAYGLSLGATSKFPKDAIAFKWADEQEQTKLLKVEWNTSRTGLINPIAVFEPTEIEGTTISRASVHNVSILEDLRLGEGDSILVYKANLIIPQIAENLTRSATIAPPKACLVCGSPTEIRETNGVRTLHCTNDSCPARKLKAFTHFVSRQAMDIEGLSEQTLEKFISAGILHTTADVFRLSSCGDVIVELDGFGEKSFENLCLAIEKARDTTAARVLTSLGLPEVGTATAKAIAAAFENDIRRVADASADELEQIDGIGSVIAALTEEWFSDPQNKALLDDILKEVKIKMEAGSPPGAGAAALPLAGMGFVITGALSGYENRDALAARIEGLGGKVSSSVSGKTAFLISNEKGSSSSKSRKAAELGVKVITEEEFEELWKSSVSQ